MAAKRPKDANSSSPKPAQPADDPNRIVKAAIYPPIGVARVGNSEEAYFLAPEVPDPLPEPPGASLPRSKSSSSRRACTRDG